MERIRNKQFSEHIQSQGNISISDLEKKVCSTILPSDDPEGNSNMCAMRRQNVRHFWQVPWAIYLRTILKQHNFLVNICWCHWGSYAWFCSRLGQKVRGHNIQKKFFKSFKMKLLQHSSCLVRTVHRKIESYKENFDLVYMLSTISHMFLTAKTPFCQIWQGLFFPFSVGIVQSNLQILLNHFLPW